MPPTILRFGCLSGYYLKLPSVWEGFKFKYGGGIRS